MLDVSLALLTVGVWLLVVESAALTYYLRRVRIVADGAPAFREGQLSFGEMLEQELRRVRKVAENGTIG